LTLTNTGARLFIVLAPVKGMRAPTLIDGPAYPSSGWLQLRRGLTIVTAFILLEQKQPKVVFTPRE
jgi:hypothetical protein